MGREYLMTARERLSLAVAAALGVSALGNISAMGAAQNTTATLTSTGANPILWTATDTWNIAPDYPSGVGAGAIFNGTTATRTVNLQGAITVGSITHHSDGAFNDTLGNGTGGSL